MGLYDLAKDWVQKQLKRDLARTAIPVDPTEAKKFVEYRKMVDFCSAAFDHVSAVKSWHIRVHGDFWIVGGDEHGTFLIPQKNEDMVYQCVGIATNLHQMIESRYGSRPMVWKVTLIPFYGRLVYDGVVMLGGGSSSSQGLAMAASESKTRKLQMTIQEAKRHGRVVKRLLQLEVEGGSREGLPTQGRIDKKMAPKEQPRPTIFEMKLLKAYSKISPTLPQNDPLGVWVFRRRGYTEQENPDHVGLILANGEPMGLFRCSRGLQPTSTDILHGALEAAETAGFRPSAILPDDFECYHRLKYLFETVPDTSIEYYHPPTPEETAAARASAEAGVC
jgi:hypothetical protein